MIYRYRGESGRRINCSNFEEVKELVKAGEWFRTQSMDFYHRMIPCEIATGYSMPENVGLFRDVCVTSVTTKYKRYYHFNPVEDKSIKIYIGKDLEDLICRELTMWAQNINAKLKAFSGRDFCSYLNAIPDEIFLKDGFKEKMADAIKKGFAKRKSKADGVTLRGIVELLDVTHELKETDQKKKEEKVSKTFEDNVQKRISEMRKKSEKELKN